MEIGKYLKKAKETLFPSHNPDEDQATAINQAAKKEAGVEIPKEPAKVNQAEEGMKAARENLASKGKSPIEEGKGKENFEKVDKKVAPRHESEGIAPEMYEEKSIDTLTPEQDKEVDDDINAIDGGAEAMETKDPNAAKEAMLNYLSKNNLVKINENGTIDFGRLKQTPGSIFSRIGTVLSALLAVATGGAIPPVNFYRLSGMEAEDTERQKLFGNLMNELAKTSGEIGATKEKATQSIEEAERAGEYEFAKGAKAQMMQQMTNELQMMKAQNVNSKDLAKYMANLQADQIPMLKDAWEKAGLTKEQAIDIINANAGIWNPATLQKTKAAFGIAGDVAGNAAKFIP